MNQRDINELREQIDIVDSQMIELFEKRMEIAKGVGEYKIANSLPIFDGKREEQLLRDKAAKLVEKEFEPYCIEFFKSLMDISKNVQKQIFLTQNKTKLFAYQGVEGAFGEQAAIDYFGEQTQKLACESFENVFQNVANGTVFQGIVPIENSTGGTIYEIYDYVNKYKCYITGEHIVKVEQSLLALKGAKLSDIKTIYSHEQGFLQCTEFLSKFDFKRVNYKNTAASAKYVAQLGDPSVAAIASERAANVYGLDVIKKQINNKKNNATRFVAISKQLNMNEQKTKVSMAFNLKHECGSLHCVLANLAKRGFNLTKIESRNIPEKPFEYRFYVDLEGAFDSHIIEKTILQLRALALEFELLGYYDPF